MAYKRILTIQDISCVGQCSMTVALPILSACGHETCILPTAVLSTHTGGFGKPAVVHLDGAVEPVWHHWQENGISFDAILVGYIGNAEGVQRVGEIAENLLAPDGLLIVDPAFADHGRIYSGLNADYAREMEYLCRRADIILPNVTEAALLTGLPYRERADEGYLRELADGLRDFGVKGAIITGFMWDDTHTGFYGYDRREGNFSYRAKRIPKSLHGTGDLFAATFAGGLVAGKDMGTAAAVAAHFVERVVAATPEASPFGAEFEGQLSWLIAQI